jgi:type VI secretion system ImpM family protein
MSAPVSGYYGKLPVSREFLRLHAAGPELRELDEWLERGVQYAKAQSGSEWPRLLDEADIWDFLFVPEGSGRVVCGAMFASRDQAGRSFPFLAFLLLERGTVAPVPWLIPLRCRHFLSQARHLLQQLRADLDWNAFRANMDALPVEIDHAASIEAGFEEYLAQTTTGEFRDRLSGATRHPRHDGRVSGQAALGYPTGTRFAEGRGGLKLPLAQSGTAEIYDLPFWFGLHARLHTVKTGTWPASLAFWNRAPSKGEPCLLLSFGRSSPNLTRFIVSPDAQDDAWQAWRPDEAHPRQHAADNALDCPDNPAAVSLKKYLALLDENRA